MNEPDQSFTTVLIRNFEGMNALCKQCYFSLLQIVHLVLKMLQYFFDSLNSCQSLPRFATAVEKSHSVQASTFRPGLEIRSSKGLSIQVSY